MNTWDALSARRCSLLTATTCGMPIIVNNHIVRLTEEFIKSLDLTGM